MILVVGNIKNLETSFDFTALRLVYDFVIIGYAMLANYPDLGIRSKHGNQ